MIKGRQPNLAAVHRCTIVLQAVLIQLRKYIVPSMNLCKKVTGKTVSGKKTLK